MQMTINMTSLSIKRKCASFGSKDNARMEIIALFCMKILKKSYLYVNTLKKLASALKVSNAFIDTIFRFLKIQMEMSLNSTMQMDNSQEMKYVPILKEDFVIKVLNVDLLILTSLKLANGNSQVFKSAKIINLDFVPTDQIVNKNILNLLLQMSKVV